ncbi:Postreplication repair E3 ubiquitin-protein ligase RAD18 [Debaryomyces fabryi]|uniref:Postreplication repair E3 ubiquitin-protein ligase RAD18 n=1 Tax=Debaryomyces fabryi TaxID=58627 RepID=A0A0V1PSF5_9ASCO|nr:Postreplication repair E3 ubiquitin-protein ligase RAD18 [Debaryomyces fabryi]KRZ99090.1 Postreplication repair E3 ubiquitin-protein ligase RAD18 [Debaryomyces fabryi]CUM45264.1 unnamed protein product [Debaryomyces fabryi]
MNSNPFSKNLQSVTDPSDWESTKLPNLKELDSLQRCYICKEFLKAPVITSCNHTFCSHCIREYLIVNSHCPLCKAEQFESNLKRVILLEEIVLCYSKFRPILLELLKKEESEHAYDKSTSPSSDTPSNLEESRKRASSDQEVIEISSDDNNTPELSEISSEITKKKIKTEASTNSRNAIPTRNEMVECPICSEVMSADLLQTQHIDYCLSGKSQPSSSRFTGTSALKYQTMKKRLSNKANNGISSFFKPADNNKPITAAVGKFDLSKSDNQNFYFDEVSKHHHNDVKKLPKLDFGSLTTPKLKEKLSHLKLPVQGTRNQLELRYNHYYILFNSNLDSNHPLSEKVLRQKLNQWELSHLAFTNQGSTSTLFNNGSPSVKSITDKNFSVKEWLDANKNEFKSLVKAARASIKNTNAKNTPSSVSDDSGLTKSPNSHPTDDPLANEGSDYQSKENLVERIDDGNSKETQPDEIGNLNFKEDIANSPLFVKDFPEGSHS